MIYNALTSNERASARSGGLLTDKIHALIAEHLGVDIKRVTDEAHFTADLGADWLDRLELMILIEDEFADLEITDDIAEEIDVVGDLIRYIADRDTVRPFTISKRNGLSHW